MKNTKKINKEWHVSKKANILLLRFVCRTQKARDSHYRKLVAQYPTTVIGENYCSLRQ